MSSSAGPSRVRRPRRSSALTSNGSTASSTGIDDGARTGLVKLILVSGDSAVMAFYLGSARRKRKGLTRREDASHASSRRRPGPITTGLGWCKECRPPRKKQRVRCRGPGMRRDDEISTRIRLLTHRVETPGQDAFLRVQPVFGLVEHHRLRAVDHFVGDLLAT